MNALEESLRLALAIDFIAFAATAAPLSPSLTLSARATAASEHSNQ